MLQQFLNSALTSAGVAMLALEYFVVLLAILCAGRLVYRLVLKAKGVDLDAQLGGAPEGFGPYDELRKPNLAMAIAMSGYLVGLGIASTGGVYATGGSMWKMAVVGIVGLLSMFLIKVSLFVNDYFILDKFRNIDEITKDHNIGVALVEGASCIASGLMIYGVMSGQSISMEAKLVDGLVYWAVGQALLIIGARVYFASIHYNVEEELIDGNTAAGMAFSGFLVALGFILQASFMGATSNIVAELGTIVTFFSIGLLVLLVSRVITDRVLVTTAAIRDLICDKSHKGAGIIAAAAFIVVAILFSGSVSPANSYALNHQVVIPAQDQDQDQDQDTNDK